MEEPKRITDKDYNKNWDRMLKIFHAIPLNAKDTKKQCEDLKELAKNTIALTPRQREGIFDRCNNVVSGNYGNTKKPEHYSQQHNFSSNGKEK